MTLILVLGSTQPCVNQLEYFAPWFIWPGVGIFYPFCVLSQQFECLATSHRYHKGRTQQWSQDIYLCKITKKFLRKACQLANQYKTTMLTPEKKISFLRNSWKVPEKWETSTVPCPLLNVWSLLLVKWSTPKRELCLCHVMYMYWSYFCSFHFIMEILHLKPNDQSWTKGNTYWTDPWKWH